MEIIELSITAEESENYRKITNRLKVRVYRQGIVQDIRLIPIQAHIILTGRAISI